MFLTEKFISSSRFKILLFGLRIWVLEKKNELVYLIWNTFIESITQKLRTFLCTVFYTVKNNLRFVGCYKISKVDADTVSSTFQRVSIDYIIKALFT
jgi:hypothetical protein